MQHLGEIAVALSRLHDGKPLEEQAASFVTLLCGWMASRGVPESMAGLVVSALAEDVVAVYPGFLRVRAEMVEKMRAREPSGSAGAANAGH